MRTASINARCCLSYWFPLIEQAGLRVPDTRIVRTSVELTTLLDGQAPIRYQAFLNELHDRAAEVADACGQVFLRTGQGSGKHEWSSCCMARLDRLDEHVANLVEWSHLVDFMGLPHDVWVARQLIDVEPVGYLPRYREMPLVREWRMFAGPSGVVSWQPYWPCGAIEDGGGDAAMYRALYPDPHTCPPELLDLARLSAKAVNDGEWSIDFLEDRQGNWWLTDMAPAECSYRYDPATGEVG